MKSVSTSPAMSGLANSHEVPAATSNRRAARPSTTAALLVVTVTTSTCAAIVRAIALLDRPDRRSLLRCGLGDLLQEVRDRLVRLRRDPDPPTGPDEVEDHPRPGVRLAGARRTLDREDRLVELHGDASRRLDRRFGFALQRIAHGSAAQAGLASEQQVTRGTERSVAVHAVRQDGVGDLEHGARHRARSDRLAGDERGRVVVQARRTAQEVDGPVHVVDGDDLAGILAEVTVDGIRVDDR